jgi:hypothetical protein
LYWEGEVKGRIRNDQERFFPCVSPPKEFLFFLTFQKEAGEIKKCGKLGK